MLVPLAFFAFLAAIIITPQVLRSRDRAKMYETMRVAYEKGQPLPPELVDALTRRGEAPTGLLSSSIDPDFTPRASVAQDRDLRRGVILLSVGFGLVLVGAAFYAGLYADGGASETFGAFAAGGAIPGCMGLAHLGLWWFNRRKSAV